MRVYEGVSVYSGIAAGPLCFFKRNTIVIERETVSNPEAEVSRFEDARNLSMRQLDDLYIKALGDAGEDTAALFEVHKMMLDDPDFFEPVIGMITEQKVNAEYALDESSKVLSNVFASMDDAYMKERAADILDISRRVQIALCPEKYKPFSPQAPSIIIADDLVPSETVQLDRHLILGFVMLEGSLNSHTSILARSMSIPAIIGTGEQLGGEYDNIHAIVDGTTGKLYIEPDDETSEAMRLKSEKIRQDLENLETLKGLPNKTKDGREIKVYANALDLSGIKDAIKNDAGGIGLFRSEFLYMENTAFPTEQQQFEVYKQAAQQMDGKKVVIRTLDIGADKQAPYFNLPEEENPAMGMRAIRICLTRPDIFKTQLRALYRASVYGNIAIMFPMIISTAEVTQIKQIVEDVKCELRNEGIEYNENVETGIMIETPASVMISDELAGMVDFFSIGTNDLTQYTLAIDRQNRLLESFCDTHHPAVLRMIEMTAAAAHDAGIWCGICGELGGDLSLTEAFLRMGIDELSVSAGTVLKLREKIRSLDLSK